MTQNLCQSCPRKIFLLIQRLSQSKTQRDDGYEVDGGDYLSDLDDDPAMKTQQFEGGTA
jgi:hypothetical protein